MSSDGKSKGIIVTSRIPTIVNSRGIYTLKMLKRTLSGGQPASKISLHVLGKRTRGSQYATVSVHTKKYLCAAKRGWRSSDGGSCWVRFAMAGSAKKEKGSRYPSGKILKMDHPSLGSVAMAGNTLAYDLDHTQHLPIKCNYSNDREP